jgi:hypothetical protein
LTPGGRNGNGPGDAGANARSDGLSWHRAVPPEFALGSYQSLDSYLLERILEALAMRQGRRRGRDHSRKLTEHDRVEHGFVLSPGEAAAFGSARQAAMFVSRMWLPELEKRAERLPAVKLSIYPHAL